ncbi:hypothetical protein LFAB_01555 [Lactiplantibacillus fabifermentans T30PCM01]|uniref:Uncharacterized protein n=2 Tax=Lactiplantibacillus fabifermentans TaxID=483011 RepID=A0A0R2NUI6_9LACO|nr:hypothetical protein LFAB_01555 [Lactiplantibacillus fabifermentans T30PCM01]KRO29380.1 hypothetical protein DY78_GL000614 [Lactiplantibacillus fabifermentans DSM 21115]
MILIFKEPSLVRRKNVAEYYNSLQKLAFITVTRPKRNLLFICLSHSLSILVIVNSLGQSIDANDM